MTFRQAGELLAGFHDQGLVVDDGYEARENARSLAGLDGRRRIAPATVRRLRQEIASWPRPPATPVPTHGDWQPRNWLVHDGVVRFIDFGRTALRPLALFRMTTTNRTADQRPRSAVACRCDGGRHPERATGPAQADSAR